MQAAYDKWFMAFDAYKLRIFIVDSIKLYALSECVLYCTVLKSIGCY